MAFFGQILQNMTLLLALSMLYNFAFRRWNISTKKGQIVAGLLFGGVALAGMLDPLRLAPGIIFDGRSMIVSTAGLFGGPITAAIAAVIPIGYRLGMGGSGTLMGVSVTLSSAALGVGYYYFRIRKPHRLKPLYLLAFGLAVHGVMLLCTLMLPADVYLAMLSEIAIPVMTIFPLGTLLLGTLLEEQEFIVRSGKAMEISEQNYRSIFENATEGIFQTAPDGRYSRINPALARMFGYASPEEMMMSVTDVGRQLYVNPDDRTRLKRLLKEQYRVEGFETQTYRKDGSVFRVSVNVHAVRDGSGRILYWEGTNEDITERKRTEQELQEEKEKFQTLSDNAPLAMVLVGAEGKFHYASPKFSGIFGYITEDVPDGRTWARKAFPDPVLRRAAISAWIEDLKDAVVGEKRPRLFPVRCKDGTEKIISFVPVLLSPDKTIMTCEDITERVRVLEALGQSEEKYRSIFENAVEGIFQTTPEGRFISVNPAMASIHGFASPEEMIAGVIESGRQLYVDPEDRARYRSLLEDHGMVEAFEAQVYRKGGNVIWTSTSARVVKDAKGQPLYFEGTVEDITARKRFELALRESEERFRMLVLDLPVALLIHDGKTIHYANPAALNLMGVRDYDEIRATPFIDLVHQDFRERVEKLIGSVLKSGEAVPVMVQKYVRLDGQVIDVEAMAIPIAFGEQGAIYSILKDITEHKRLESQLQQAQKMEAIGTLAGGVAHDFNNILTVIIGFSSLLKMQLEHDSQKKAFVDQILTSSEKAASLTRSLLAFSRKQRIVLKPLDIDETIGNVAKMLKRLLTEDIELTITPSGEALTVMADPTQIDQILINLATNARDAMPAGGTLGIKTEGTTLGDDFITAEGYGKHGDYVLISVTDTGHGMDRETARHIFEPFFTTKEVGKGTGLGLATVYGIVKQHEGYITVSSEPGQGTTFTVYLPRAAMKEEDEILMPRDIEKGSGTILLGEDDSGIRTLMAEILRQNGYAVVEAQDGKETVRIFRDTSKVDMVILDVVMPGLNGKEVFSEITRTHPDTKFLFTSGYTGDVVFEKGIGNDRVAFIAKPFVPDDLLLKVKDVLGQGTGGET